MPELTFHSTDATLFSQTITGNLTRTLGGLSTETTPFTDYISSIGLGTCDILIGPVNAVCNGGGTPLASVGIGPSAKFEQVLDIDYLHITLGIPEGATIKKMVVNTPCNINATVETSYEPNGLPERVSLSLAGIYEIIVNGILKYVECGTLSGGRPSNLFLTLSGIPADANMVIFDFSDPEDYITRDNFVSLYSRIKFLFFVTAAASHIYDGMTPALPECDLFYHAEMEPEWRIIVTYQAAPITWTLDSPPANQAIQAGDTIVYTFEDASGITGIEVNGVPATFTVVGNTVTITAPDFPTTGPDHTATPTVTTFSGTVPLQTVPTINFENAPGIYTFIDGETHDTYYNRISSIEGTEIETKIPNPTGRTGFY